MDVLTPRTLDEALRLKAEVPAARPIQGGTDVMVELNFDTYRVVRQAEAPKIEVYLVPSGGKKWGGIGECGTATIAPAIANAIFAASGKRVRELPLKNVKLSQLASI